MAPLVKKLSVDPRFDTQLCVTAQHREMLDQVLEMFQLIPDYDLDIMSDRQDLSDITSLVLNGMKGVFKSYQPDWVLVHGDTTTTFAASLAAYYQKIPVGHVEAGLRTGNRYSPWPEEMNRRLAGALSELHFAPTKQARDNLLNEGVIADQIHVTGNTVIDALLEIVHRLRSNKALSDKCRQRIPEIQEGKKLILVTGHRRESFGEGFKNLCTGLKEIARRRDVQIIYPVHLNPNVHKPVYEALSGHPNISLIKPLDYLTFVWLLDQTYFVITDSGGLQEEAPSLGKPVLVTRETTERPEALNAGTVRLVGTDVKKIIMESEALLDNISLYKNMAYTHNPYGDGQACQRIIQILAEKISD